MNRKNRILASVSQLLDRWDDLPNDVTSEPELESVAEVMSKIEKLTDDDSEEFDVNDLDVEEIIEKEIKWSEEHRGMKGKEFEDGFIAGLRQTLFLINAAQHGAQPP